MRVCLVTTSYPRTPDDDAGIFIGRLVAAYSKIGLEGEVIVPYDSTEPVSEQHGKFTISRFRYGLFSKGRLAFGSGIMPNLRKEPLLAFQIPGLVLGLFLTVYRRANSDSVFHANWIIAGFAVWLVSIFKSVRYIITLRGEDVRILRNPFVKRLMQPVIRKAEYVTSVNVSFLDQIQDYYGIDSEKLKCIPNGVSLEETNEEQYQHFVNKRRIDLGAPYGLFIGSVIPRKRIEMLIEIFSLEALRNYHLIVCGRDLDQNYVQKLNQLLTEKSMNKRVHFMGLVSPNEIPYFFKMSKFYISSSEFEGRPNSVLEAFLAKIPVVVSDIPAHREIVKNRENGFLFRTAEEAARQILELVGDPELKTQITNSAFHLIEKHSWESAATQYHNLMCS